MSFLMFFILSGKEQEPILKEFISVEKNRWKDVTADIKNVLSSLQGGLDNWILYDSGIETLTHFINEGESVMSRTNEEKEQHFSEIPEYQEKLKQVNESGNFLMGVCREPLAEEIKQTLASLNREFQNVTESFEEFKKVEIIGKGRQEYAEGVARISEWLKNAEELMMQPIPCIHSNLKDHLQDLSVSTYVLNENVCWRIFYYTRKFFDMMLRAKRNVLRLKFEFCIYNIEPVRYISVLPMFMLQ